MEVFILKLLPVDALTSSAILVGEVTSLDHETFDDCRNKQTSKKLTSVTLNDTQVTLLKMQQYHKGLGNEQVFIFSTFNT